MMEDAHLPDLQTPVPLRREHRLYQADWLMRYYGFAADELVTPETPWLDLDVDPKTAWALAHIEQFPVEVMDASLERLLRVPGLGPVGARRIVAARSRGRLDFNDLKAMHVTLSTNADPGQGTGSDSLLVDDLTLVYNSGISHLSVKGKELTPNAGSNVYETELAEEVNLSDIEVTADGKGAKTSVTLETMDGGVKALITVTAGDLKSNDYQLLIKGATMPTGIRNVGSDESHISKRYNLNGYRLNESRKGLVIERNAKGVRKMLAK